MVTVKHGQTREQAAGADAGAVKFFLIAGEDFLVRESLDTLKAVLLKGDAAGFGLELLDGRSTPMGDIVEQVTTFSFLQTRKVIVVKNAPVFATQVPQGEILYTKTDQALLTDLVEKGIPDGHFLILTAGSLDRRKKLFKTMDRHGVIIDCTVAQGARKADLDEQRAVLQSIAAKKLDGSGKQLDQAAFTTLLDLTGFNPDLFARNIEKLVDYSGKAGRITLDHVRAVVRRDKKDPIFSLTNALMDRNPGQALFYLSSLFRDGFHPLQILKAFENQIRKALVAKAFAKGIEARHPNLRPAHMNFNAFKQQMMPAITARDNQVKQRLEGEGGNGGKKRNIPADLLLAPNPKSPYPVFQTFQKSAKFSIQELRAALIALSDLDYALKSSSAEAEMGIENFVISFCQKGG